MRDRQPGTFDKTSTGISRGNAVTFAMAALEENGAGILLDSRDCSCHARLSKPNLAPSAVKVLLFSYRNYRAEIVNGQ